MDEWLTDRMDEWLTEYIADSVPSHGAGPEEEAESDEGEIVGGEWQDDAEKRTQNSTGKDDGTATEPGGKYTV